MRFLRSCLKNPISSFLCLLIILATSARADKAVITVGSKMFGESYVLAEMACQLLEANDFQVERKLGLGGTLITYEALQHGEIDIYPEYTGTFAKVILKDETLVSFEDSRLGAEEKGLMFLPPLGFNNTYGLAVRQEIANKYRLNKISDLKGLDQLNVSFNFEFINREDGWANLKKEYGLSFESIKTLEQTLAYQALASGKSDLIVIYSTDGKVLKYQMKVLEDDRGFFPKYEAAFLAQQGLPEKAIQLLQQLSGRINEEKMMTLNARVDVDGVSYSKVANDFLIQEGLIGSSYAKKTDSQWRSIGKKILWLTWEHIYLVLISTLAACLVGVPLGIVLFRNQQYASPILYIVGLLQTIPSLALLVYMIPLFGVSVQSALMALFLYSLLPILQNTYSGLLNVNPQLVHAAEGIGLYKNEILRSVELPLAAPIIIAGVRVAAVINVGTATIAAFIGSGGLGELIVQGLTLNDLSIMQQGAIPAAILAILVNIGFTQLEKYFQ